MANRAKNNVFFLCADCVHCSGLRAPHNESLRGSAEWSSATQATVGGQPFVRPRDTGSSKKNSQITYCTRENVLYKWSDIPQYHLLLLEVVASSWIFDSVWFYLQIWCKMTSHSLIYIPDVYPWNPPPGCADRNGAWSGKYLDYQTTQRCVNT